MSNITIISIDGVIGSGKSTLLDTLKKHKSFSNYHFLQEPVDIWESITDKNNEMNLFKVNKNPMRIIKSD